MSKPMIAVLRGGSENTFEMIELGEESRKYVHINVINIHERWQDGEKITFNSTYPLDRCNDAFFNHTDFERKYFESVG